MKQATQPGFYTGDDGVDVFVAAGTVRPDGHADIARLTSDGFWRDIPTEEAPGPGPVNAPPAATAPPSSRAARREGRQ